VDDQIDLGEPFEKVGLVVEQMHRDHEPCFLGIPNSSGKIVVGLGSLPSKKAIWRVEATRHTGDTPDRLHHGNTNVLSTPGNA